MKKKESRKKYYENGDVAWRNKDGQLHRLDGPAFEYSNGSKLWYKDGELHRLDGPAIELVNGDKEWFQRGKKHRIDGPAIQWGNGETEWWIRGTFFHSKEAFFEVLTDEEKEIAIFSPMFINGKFSSRYIYFK
jgi:hypothetical protein